jgi:hypothetical protein
MSLELDQFFNLQVNEVEDAPLQQSLLTTIRTPIEASNPNTNSVFIKIPKIGLLTSDSMVTFRLKATSTPGSNCRVNLLNGALGAIKRFTLRVDNKIISDIERPSQYVTQHLYSQNSASKISCLHHYLFGCNTRITVDLFDGIERPDARCGVVISYDAGTQVPTLTAQEFLISSNDDENYRFGVPLSFLGATFLTNNNLPMFLMKDREVILELQFEKDAREYVIGTDDIDLAYCGVDLPTVELVSTHILQDQELETAMLAQIKKSPFKYPMIDTYLVKSIMSGQLLNTEKTETYRINLQGRELHSMLLAFRDTVLPDHSGVGYYKIWAANQASDALGDEEYLLKMNGRNVFERPVNSQAIIYFLTQLYNKGSSPQVSKHQFTCDNNTILNAAVNTDEFNRDLRGICHWVGFDFENGNNVVFGGGLQQTAPLEIQYSITPRTAIFPVQTSTHEVNAYMSISKLLTIGAGQVGISF